ncbi:MAG: GNAT family N-acetyltransferase [Flavobacteriaceae bacterium]|jgi:RimJ/RimL family protein N-acetyltransferase|nr:GNAT family N-acetyltransferase [Flavobacteriaceae bacterium]
MKTYETERLILKPTGLDDVKLIVQLLNSETFLKYVGDRNVRTLEDAENYIKRRCLPQIEKLGYGNFTIIRKFDNKKLGTCGIFVRNEMENPDIGFAFLPEFEGKGYAFEAANFIKNLGFSDFGMKKIGGITVEYNHRSRKLLEKLGLKFVKKFFMEGDPEELMYYEIENAVS